MDDELAGRPEGSDWKRVEAELAAHGCTVMRSLLSPADCARLAGAYSNDELFRSRIVMARQGFGRGEYKYFSDPLPEIITELREKSLSAADAHSESVE